MSGVDVCVVCNSDAESESWPSYILDQALSTSGSAGVSSRTLLDTDLSRPSSADTLRTARAVVVIVSLGHLDYLRRCAGDGGPVYAACSPEHGLILLCGVSDHDLEQSAPSGRKISDHFPRYSSWQRVPYDVEQSVLARKLKTLMSAQSLAVKLLQTTARCEVCSLFLARQCGFSYRYIRGEHFILSLWLKYCASINFKTTAHTSLTLITNNSNSSYTKVPEKKAIFPIKYTVQ